MHLCLYCTYVFKNPTTVVVGFYIRHSSSKVPLGTAITLLNPFFSFMFLALKKENT